MPTQIAKSIKADGSGDYTTFAAAFAALPASVVATDEYWTFTVNDSSTYSENPDATTTADATRSVTLTVADGQTPLLATSTSNGLNWSINYGIIEKLKISVAASGTGIRQGGTDSIVRRCEIYGTSTSANRCIQFRGGSDRRYVQRNILRDINVGIHAFIGADGSEITNNVIYGNTGSAIDLGTAMNSCLVYHNTVDAATAGHGILIGSTATPANTYKNNMFRVVNGVAVYVNAANDNAISSNDNRFRVTGTGAVGRISASIYTTLANWQAATVHDDDSEEGAPPWTDPASRDYTLTTVDPGAAGLGVTVDYTGATRAGAVDRGAYEYHLPLAPSGPGAVADSSTQITVSWTDNSDNEDGFEIWRAPDVSGAPGAFALITTTAADAVSYPNTGLTAATIYWYKVRATNAHGESAYTSNVSATTDPAAGGWKRKGIRDAVRRGIADGVG